MKKKISSLLIALLSCTGFQAQNSAPLINTMIPPSPSSAAFRQFAGYTPSLATGTVNVPIDLYNVQVGDFSLPISMQYYTQGIKMTDNPYPLGYGWILSPGLRITRTIMGRADMYYPMDVQTAPLDKYDYGRKAVYDRSSGKHPTLDTGTLIDTQHDVYTVHLPHADHTFLLDEEGGVYTALTANNRLKIVPDGLLGFTVTDENGIIYHFGTAEGASGNYVEYYPGEMSIATSWMLRKIVLPGEGREISFTWRKVTQSELSYGPFFGGDVLQDSKDTGTGIPEDGSPAYTDASQVGSLTPFGIYGDVLQLQQISFPGGTVDFTYLSTTNPLLTDMTVKNLYGTTVKTIGFTYETATSNRCLLASVDLSDEGKYSFEYDSNRFSNLNAQDWWGYYNGKSNSSLVPQVSIKTYSYTTPNSTDTYFTYGYADRSMDASAMQAYLLKKVTYPTGGYTSFTYEPHRFTGSLTTNTGLGTASRFRLTQGGGLRVKTVSSSAGGDAPLVVKNYVYGDNEDGLANVLYEPTLETFLEGLNGLAAEPGIAYTYRHLLVNAQSGYMRHAMNAPALWYGQVTEYVEGAGRTVYTYRRPVPENTQATHSICRDFSFKAPTGYHTLFSRGCLLTNERQEKLETDGSYSPVKETARVYSVREAPHRLTDVYVSRATVSLLSSGPDIYYENSNIYENGEMLTVYGDIDPYVVNPLSIRFYYEQLDSVNTTYYSGTANRTVKEGYTYSNYQLTGKSTTGSDGTGITETYSYPASYTGTDAVLLKLKELNMIGSPYRTVKTTGVDSETIRTEFALFNGSFYKPYKQFFKKNSGTEVCRAQYDYDTAGNVRSITENGTLKNCILWGYNYTVPVAVIKGLDYTGVSSLVSSTYLNNLNGSSASVISTALGNVRTAIGSSGLVTTYTYTPLVGITSMTGPNGNKVTYSYDTAGRLSTVKNHSSQTEQTFEYHLLNE